MQFKPRSLRLVALLTGCVVASSAFNVAPAHAADKSKNWKYGAVAAGVVGAYLLSKGKVAPAAAAAAAAGGYYAYKKGEDVKCDERYNNRNRYGYRDRNGNYGSGYNGNRNDDYRNDGYRYDGSRDGERYGSNSGGDVYPGSEGSYGVPQYRGNANVRGRGNDGRRNGRQSSENYDLRPYRR